MKVRPAKAKDARKCAQISPMRSPTELKSLLDRSDVNWLVIENNTGAVVGIAIIHLWTWNKAAWVWDLTVAKKERNKGYGRTLLKGMIHAAREMGARVLMDFDSPKQSPLTDLFLKTGFRICGTNDRWFACDKDSTAVFYGYDL